VLIGAFQQERFYRPIETRWRRMTAHADAAAVFADFPAVDHPPGGPAELPIDPTDVVANEWAVIVDAPGFAASLVAWEQPGGTGRCGADDRCFEAIWTLDPQATRRACRAAARMAATIDPPMGERLEELLADRPLALEQPVPTLTALANRVVAYLER
jgi:DICT domain-containing protein